MLVVIGVALQDHVFLHGLPGPSLLGVRSSKDTMTWTSGWIFPPRERCVPRPRGFFAMLG